MDGEGVQAIVLIDPLPFSSNALLPVHSDRPSAQLW
jgi:hypothetical protein